MLKLTLFLHYEKLLWDLLGHTNQVLNLGKLLLGFELATSKVAAQRKCRALDYGWSNSVVVVVATNVGSDSMVTACCDLQLLFDRFYCWPIGFLVAMIIIGRVHNRTYTRPTFNRANELEWART